MRHAQPHWLNLQASRAVAEACDRSFPDVEALAEHDIKTQLDVPFVTQWTLAGLHQLAIVDAAKALTRAEIIARKIAERGEQPYPLPGAIAPAEEPE